MYRRFLNNDDYTSVTTSEALNQMTRGDLSKLMLAESDAETSVIEYLSENYEIEKEMNVGKFIADYDRKVTFPVGAHLYFDGKIHKVIRSISGFKAPSTKVFWKEIVSNLKSQPANYSQFATYYKEDVCMFNGIPYECLEENGFEFNDIRIPNLNGWEVVIHEEWLPIEYKVWDVVKYNDKFYTLVSLDDFDNNVDPFESTNWGMIADYDSTFNEYDLSGHDYVVCDGAVFRPVINVNADDPVVGVNLTPSDPRNQSIKKHMVRIAIYELSKRIAPNNVSIVRVKDYEDSMKWLSDAAKLKLNPRIPRKLDVNNKEVLDWQIATFQTEFDPYKNQWLI